MRLISALTIVAGLLMPSLAQANLITNGDFTSCSGCGGAFATKPGGSTDVSGWLVTGTSVDVILSYWQAPPLGGNSIDLNGSTGDPGNRAGGVSQSFATVAGQSYLVNFYLSGNPDNNNVDSLKSAVVSAVADSSTYTFDTSGISKSNMGWVLESFVFSAISSTSTLSFAGVNQDDFYGAAIGNVSVSETPEPGTLMMMGFGMLALFGYGVARARRHA